MWQARAGSYSDGTCPWAASGASYSFHAWQPLLFGVDLLVALYRTWALLPLLATSCLIVKSRRGWTDGWFEIWQQDVAGGMTVRRVGLHDTG